MKLLKNQKAARLAHHEINNVHMIHRQQKPARTRHTVGTFRSRGHAQQPVSLFRKQGEKNICMLSSLTVLFVYKLLPPP